MPLIAGIDGKRLEIHDETGERRFVFEPPRQADELPEAVDTGPLDAEAVEVQSDENQDAFPSSDTPRSDDSETLSAFALCRVDAPMTACLLPAERLLQRPFSLPFEHPRFIDANTLAQELADQAGAEEEDWWLSWQAERAADGVRGLVFALPMDLKQELTAAAVSTSCPYIGPDIAVRLSACLVLQEGAGAHSAAVLDADADGLMLGVKVAGVWRGMRRLNCAAGRSMQSLAHEALASLKAMGFDAATMPLHGRLDTAWKQAFDALAGGMGGESAFDWQVVLADAESSLAGRLAANAMAFGRLGGDAPLNFRHGAWALQTDWSKRIGPWRRSAALLAGLVLLAIGHDAWQLQRLESREQATRAAIEQAFHRALPGVAMIDPMLQLRQAAGGGASGDAWKFIRELEAITQLGKQESNFKPQNIAYADGEVLLGGMVPDFAAANRIRDALASILGRKVDLLDTDLNDKQVRIRLRWSS